MALRAGYYGLKNSVKRNLEKLLADMAGAKIIKSFGDGLNLTNAGKLNLTAATASKIGGIKVGEGLEIVDGVLNVTSTGSPDYSTDEQETGILWIDEKPIYQKTFHSDSAPASGSVQLLTGVDTLVRAYGSIVLGTASYAMPVYEASNYRGQVINTSGTVTLESTGAGKYDITVFYTKAS